MVRTISIVGDPSSSLFYLKWQAPTKNGETVIGYYVFYQTAGSPNYRSVGIIYYHSDSLEISAVIYQPFPLVAVQGIMWNITVSPGV